MASPALAKTYSRTRKFGKFIQKHETLFVLVGALIVFITFLVRDAQRERVKEFADTLSNAENTFVLRNSLDEVKGAITASRTVFLASAPRNKVTRHIEDMQMVAVASYRFADVASEVATVDLFADRVGDTAAPHKLTELSAQLAALNDRIEALGKVADSRIFAKAEIDEWSNITDACLDLTTQLNKIESDAVNRAEELRREAERKYRVYTTAGNALYVIGWGLAFIGRIFGFKVGSEA